MFTNVPTLCLHQVTGATNIALSMLADMWMVFSSFFGGKPDKPPGKDRWGARRVQKLTSQNTCLHQAYDGINKT